MSRCDPRAIFVLFQIKVAFARMASSSFIETRMLIWFQRSPQLTSIQLDVCVQAFSEARQRRRILSAFERLSRGGKSKKTLKQFWVDWRAQEHRQAPLLTDNDLIVICIQQVVLKNIWTKWKEGQPPLNIHLSVSPVEQSRCPLPDISTKGSISLFEGWFRWYLEAQSLQCRLHQMPSVDLKGPSTQLLLSRSTADESASRSLLTVCSFKQLMLYQREKSWRLH